jgi:hypothetical protein
MGTHGARPFALALQACAGCGPCLGSLDIDSCAAEDTGQNTRSRYDS